MSPMPPPLTTFDGPPPPFEPKEVPLLELPLLFRLLDSLFFLAAALTDFARWPRPLELRQPPLPLPRSRPRPAFPEPDLERLGRLLGFLKVLLFENEFGRVCVRETVGVSAETQ